MDARAISICCQTSLADEAFRIGPPKVAQSYLNGDAILDAARRSGAEALHPGYGFLSENAAFAQACSTAGVTFIGPPPEAIDAMGSKSVAKNIMADAGVPVCPGYHGPNQDDSHLEAEAARIGYPLMIKAVMGGGGKGMRLVTSPEEFQNALEACRREALTGFADDRMLLERFVEEPRHIEVQVFADTLGGAIHLFERDCSVQRRHQKVLEEAPAPGLSWETRAELGAAAVRAAKAVGYVGAGTVEFLLDTRTKDFFFCEMNTRLQVEHPVTEMVTGQDLVEWQLMVAAGHPLPVTEQSDITLSGHAIEARVYAESVERGFLPATGTLRRMRLPTGSEDSHSQGRRTTRVDTGVREGDSVTVHYDPMIAKVITHAPTRRGAISALRQALRDFQVIGVPTNLDFCGRAAWHPHFMEGGVTTAFLEDHGDEILPPVEEMPPPHATALALAAVVLRQRSAFISPKDISPWSASEGPWRVVGVRKQAFDCTGPWSKDSNDQYALRETAESRHEKLSSGAKGKLAAVVECLVNGEFVVDVSGERHRVERASLDGAGSMTATVDGRRYSIEAMIEEEARDESMDVTLWSRHGPIEGDEHERYRYHLKVVRPRRMAPATSSVDGASTGYSNIVSPMPGRVVRMIASDGDEVEKGQELMIIEAMKMEHTIAAASDGRVDRVYFSEGDIVDEGTVLLSLARGDV